jgi:hypothetical protein
MSCVVSGPVFGALVKATMPLRARSLHQVNALEVANPVGKEDNQFMNNTNTLNFGQAVEALKQGKRVSRAGWNGKGMFLFLLPAGRVPKTAIHDPALRAVMDEQIEGDHFEALGSIRMFTADKKVLTGWLASQTDILSEDWEILE